MPKQQIPIGVTPNTPGYGGPWVTTPNYFCSTSTDAWQEFVWSSNGTVTSVVTPYGTVPYKCFPVKTSAIFPNPFICYPSAIPFNLTFNSGSPIAGMACVKWSESADPAWSNGNEGYLCAPAGAPYGVGNTWQQISYALPNVSQVTPLTGPTVGGINITITGTNFGPNVSWVQVTVGGVNCSIYASVFVHEKIICKMAAGEGKVNLVIVNVAGQINLNQPAFQFYGPNVTGVSPPNSLTGGGGNLNIVGNNFGTSYGTVYLGSSVCTPTYWSDTAITCTIPPGAGANGVKVVTMSGIQSQTSNIFPWSYTPPFIQSISPSSYTTSGGIVLMITGTSLGSLTYGTAGTVIVGTVCVTQSWDEGLISCLLPAGSGQNVLVNVTVGGQASNLVYFNYTAPSITDVSPKAQLPGPGVLLTLTGTSFGSGGGVVIVGSSQCTYIPSQYDHTRVICLLPNATGYNVNVNLTISGQQSNVKQFSYLPVINAIAQLTVWPTKGNVPLTLTGTSFIVTTDPNLLNVTVGTSNCPLVGTPTVTQIICTLPQGQGLNVPTYVTAGGNQGPSFLLNYDAPSLSGISPEGGPATGNYNISLWGDNFGLAPSVTIGVTPCDVKWFNHTYIICSPRVSSGANQNIYVTVANQNSNAKLFTFFPPNITSLVPSTGRTQGGINVTIWGTGFSGGVNVLVGAQSVAVTDAVNTTTLVFLLPAGSGSVNVLVQAGLQTSNVLPFKYDGPNIFSIYPTDATTEGGVTLTILGENFGSTPAVTVGGTGCPLVFNRPQNSTYLECTLPRGSGPVNVQVSISGQVGDPYPWNYTAPTISDINPSHGPTSGGQTTTIFGLNFGSSGTILIGGTECPWNFGGTPSYTDRQIVCQVPPGQSTNQPVLITVSTFTSPVSPKSYTYDPPAISSLAPTSVPTTGTTVITIRGSNFGLSAVVTIAGLLCPQSVSSPQTHSQILCTPPIWQGVNQVLNVQVGDQNVTKSFKYDGPVITSVSPPNGTTAGGVNITLNGQNFGASSQPAFTITVDGNSPAQSWYVSPTQIIFLLPPGTGATNQVTLTIATQSTNAQFAYLPPVLSSISTTSGCTNQAPQVVKCPVDQHAGIVLLTLNGANFGSDPSLVYVQIGILNATVNSVANNRIVCVLPVNEYGGYNLPVFIYVDGQSTTQNYLSYSGPVITAGTLDAVPSIGPKGSLSFTDTASYVVTFAGEFFGNDILNVSVRYGRKGSITGKYTTKSKEYNCAVTAVSQDVNGISAVTCTIPDGGAGNQLVFQVASGLMESVEGTDTLSYPQPTIANNSLRYGSESATPEHRLTGQSSQGDTIYFDVGYIGGDVRLIQVFYGQVGAPKTTSCYNVVLSADKHTLGCTMAPGFGDNYQFVVVANGYQSDPSLDYYSYPEVPEIFQVSGCSDVGNVTTNCPTAGGNTIVIQGDHFTDTNATYVTIGGVSCTNATITNGGSSITCQLPAGAGVNLGVVVQIGKLFSQPAYSVSYAKANITQISGCNYSSDLSAVNCDRAGGQYIQITGNSFGPPKPPPTVLIGGEFCTVVDGTPANSDGFITCQLGPGNQTNLNLLFIQTGGILTSSAATISYAQCNAGFYLDGICLGCPMGTYVEVSGAQLIGSCKPCPSGTYQNGTGSSSCTACPPAFYSVQNTSDSAGPIGCTPCPARTYNNAQGQTACFGCPPGSASNATQQTSCSLCPVGSYTGQSSQAACTVCGNGTFAGSPGSLSCSACPAGTAAGSINSSQCTDCTAGTYSPSPGRSTCLNCEAGKYVQTSKQANCLICPDGKFANTSGLQNCYDCPAGFTSSHTGSQGPTQCNPCPKGQYSPDPGSENCLLCPQQTYANQTGQSQCTACPKGTHASVSGTTDCSPCPTGTSGPTEGLVNCALCDAGSFSNTTGAISCTNCPPGTYQQIGGQSYCNLCGTGRYINNEGQKVCLDCDTGKYANDTGYSVCLDCNTGRYSGAAATSCSDCLPGYSASNPGASICVACSPGFYQDQYGSSQCSRCPVGTFTNSFQSLSCTNCTTGKFAAQTSSAQCQDCPSGTISNVTGLSVCSACDIGYYAPKPGQSICLPCAAGAYIASTGEYGCRLCGVGTFSNVSASAVCYDCPKGAYQSGLGQSKCTLCEPGKASASFAQSSCVPCGLGQQQPLPGQTSCYNCARGYYASSGGTGSCTGCTPGYFSGTGGASLCTPCPLGTYNNEYNATGCHLCGPGFVQPAAGSTSCNACALGSAVGVSSQGQCQACQPGTFANQTALPQCTLCSVGTYVTQTLVGDTLLGGVNCIPCDIGEYADVEGLGACKACPVGTHAPNTGTDKCELCPMGSYMSNTGAGELCDECAPGFFTEEDGAVVCSPCAAGRFANDSGSVTCEDCQAGYSQGAGGQANCTACPSGRYIATNNAERCDSCIAGKYANQTGSTTCDVCPAGKYQDSIGGVNCTDCPIGSYSGNNSFACKKCDAGRYANVTGSLDCGPCADGYYQSDTGKSSCSICPAGTQSALTRCTPCDGKSIAPNPGTRCLPCAPLASASLDHTRCYCQVGYANYLDYGPESGPDGYSCRLCPEGAECIVSPTYWDQMKALKGWWMVNDYHFYKCNFAQDCPGGSVVAKPSTGFLGLASGSYNATVCAIHRSGPLCAICDSGYLSILGGNCQKCQSAGVTWVMLLVIIAAIGGAVGSMMYVMLQSGRDLLHAAIQHEEFKRRDELGFIVDYDPDYEFLSNRYGDAITIKGAPAPKANFTFKMKIVLSFSQILSTMAIGLEIDWPVAFKSFVLWLVPSNLDFVQISTLGCIVSYDYYSKLILMCVIPIVLLGILLALYLFPKYYKYKKDGVARKLARRKFWRLLLFFLFLIYPSVSSVILRTYVCRTVEGVPYLLADFTLRCYTHKWTSYAIFAGFMILVYPLGIPTFFGVMLYRYKDRLQQPGTRAQLGFLYDAYTDDLWWFEMLDMAHKLWVTSLVAFLPIDWQMPFALFGVLFYLAAVSILKPYIRKSDDRLHLLGQVELLLLLLAGNVYNQTNSAAVSATVFGEWSTGFRDQFISSILIMLVVLFFAVFLVQAVQSLLKIWRANKKQEEEAGSRPTTPKSSQQKQHQRKPTVAESADPTGELELQEYATSRQKLRPLTHAAIDGKMDGSAHMVGNPLWNINSPVYDPTEDQIKEIHSNPLNQAIVLEEKDITAFTSAELMGLAEFVGDGEYVVKKGGENYYLKEDGQNVRVTRRVAKRRIRRDSEDESSAPPVTEYEEEVVAVKPRDPRKKIGNDGMVRYDFATYSVVRGDKPAILPGDPLFKSPDGDDDEGGEGGGDEDEHDENYDPTMTDDEEDDTQKKTKRTARRESEDLSDQSAHDRVFRKPKTESLGLDK